MQKPTSTEDLTPTLAVHEYESGGAKGVWLWDETRGMNLSMRAPTRQEAFVEALTYYQERLTEVESELHTLRSRVDAFVEQFKEEDA